MFIQVQNSQGNLVYFEFENLVALNETENTLYVSPEIRLRLKEGEVKKIINRMCQAGLIAGLGRNAQETKDYPYEP